MLDNVEAVKWWRMAADQGEPRAQNFLGWMYLKCLGVRCDSREAAGWYRKAAEQGLAAAQCNLGYLFEHGQGVPLDYTEALTWYELAAAQGNSAARDAMKSLAAIMTRKQLEESESRVSAWQQKKRTIPGDVVSMAAIESHD